VPLVRDHQAVTDDDDGILAEQVRYYRERAPQYDRWWHRTHQYELDPARREEWFAEVRRLEATVDDLAPTGRVLELACGTGLWTERLAHHAERVTAVDASPEALALNRGRLQSTRAQVEHVEADVFTWQPAERYDVVFFSFWLSHVPPGRAASFWDLVARALVPGGRAIFVDNRWDDTWKGRPPPDGWTEPRTDIGSEYVIVKRYWEPEELEAELADLGWHARVWTTGRSFMVGTAVPAAPTVLASDRPGEQA
jgi:demethylmenaquinone methyltransferase/2-methoxy-6-polyprenyl-1,4-benzoquinol methylase